MDEEWAHCCQILQRYREKWQPWKPSLLPASVFFFSSVYFILVSSLCFLILLFISTLISVLLFLNLIFLPVHFLLYFAFFPLFSSPYCVAPFTLVLFFLLLSPYLLFLLFCPFSSFSVFFSLFSNPFPVLIAVIVSLATERTRRS